MMDRTYIWEIILLMTVKKLQMYSHEHYILGSQIQYTVLLIMLRGFMQ